jgi:outer membrane immunogenic protein
MRRLLVVLGLIGLISPGLAADYDLPTLRGSDVFVPAFPTYPRWDGSFFGGQLSYGNLHADFVGATPPQVEFLLRNTTILSQMLPDQWQVLGSNEAGAGGLGGFAGYNWQFDRAIVGVEFNYTHSSFNAGAPSSPLTRRQTVDGLITDVTLDASASLHITDLATTRARFGWAVDQFMPYMTIGLAAARADVSLSTQVFVTQSDPTILVPNPNPPPAQVPAVVGRFVFSNAQTKSSAYMWGYSGGGGLEWALTQNLFARADYEYISLSPVMRITSHFNIAHLGLGVRF